MFLQEIPDGIFTTTLVQIRYDCDGGFERCGKEWTLKYKDAQANFTKNGGRHICRQCGLKANNPGSRPEVREKVKQTCLEKYGTTCPLNTAENTVARVDKMFGSEEAVQEIVEKRRATSRKKFGTDHPMQNDAIKEKQRQVFQEKYGVDAPLQNAEIMQKVRQTNMERYGVENVASSPEVRVKMAQTTLERYGVEHYNQLPEMKDYLRDNCPQWLKESWEAGGPNKGITRPDEWNDKQRETVEKLIDEGKWLSSSPKNTLKGWYRSDKCQKQRPCFRSSYELKVHWHLDHDSDVDWYEYEPFQVAYSDTEGKKRHYIMDFVVHYKDGRLLAIEVKNNYSQGSELSRLKKEAFIAECGNFMEHQFWANEKIKSLGLDLEELLLSDRVSLFVSQP